MAVQPIHSKYYHWQPHETSYEKTPAGIASVEADTLKFDPLKGDALKGDQDPLAPGDSKRVRSRYKEYGISLYPEEAIRLGETKKAYETESKSAIGQMSNYFQGFMSELKNSDSRFYQEIAAATQQGQEAISGIETPEVKMTGGLSFTNINVMNSSGGLEGTYRVPSQVASNLVKEKDLKTQSTNGGLNVSVKTNSGHIIGQELHDALREAYQQGQKLEASQKKQLGMAQSAAEYAASSARNSATNELNTQIGIASDKYFTERNQQVTKFDQEFSQGMKQYYAIGSEWGKIMNGAKQEQRSTTARDSKGIGDLARSGILDYGMKRG